MSHYTVTVRLPSDLNEEEVDRAIEDILAPYNEQGDDTDSFMEFQDTTDEYKEEWESGEIEMVDYKGTLYFPWDSELASALGIEKHTEKFDEAVKKLEHLNISYKRKYKDFDDFAQNYKGGRKHVIDGQTRYGYFSNPNAKWDWYTVGGRWNGHWPKINGSKVDYLRIDEISFAASDLETDNRISEFVQSYTEYFKTGVGDTFGGPRDAGLRVGLVLCKDENELTEKDRAEARIVKWKRQLKEGVDRYDVIYPIPDSAEFRSFLKGYYNSLRTFSYMDKDGWVEAGKMGWFGMDGSDTESRKEYADKYMTWLTSGDQRDWVVCVDCHI